MTVQASGVAPATPLPAPVPARHVLAAEYVAAGLSPAPLFEVQPADDALYERLAECVREYAGELDGYAHRIGGWANLGLMLGTLVRVEQMEAGS